MGRFLVVFLGAELVIGAVALSVVLAMTDDYLQAGYRVLTRRGERVLGPVARRVGPAVRRLIVWSRPRRGEALRLVVLARRLDVLVWRWVRVHLYDRGLRLLLQREVPTGPQ